MKREMAAALNRAMVAFGFMAFFANPVQASPNINDNFTADITVTQIGTKPQVLAQRYTWYEWYTGHLSRVDLINPDDSVEEQVFQFLPGNPISSCNDSSVTISLPGKNGREYAYNVPKNTCSKKALPKLSASLPVPHSDTIGFWDFLAQATISGSCSSRIGNNSGTLWTYAPPEGSKYTEISVCVASDNATPYWIEWQGASPFCPKQNPQGPHPTCELAEIIFNDFTAGIPLIDNFCPGPDAAAACGLTRDQ